MTLFEVVRLVLARLYTQANARYGETVDKIIGERMNELSESYKKLADAQRKPIDYRDPAIRFAYVYTYVAAHGDYIIQVLEDVRSELGGKVFGGGNVRVSCLGGGPGSDVIAVYKYLAENAKIEKVTRVRFYLVDQEEAWGDTWAEIDDELSAEIMMNTHFRRLDVTDKKSWEYTNSFFNADLFTISYFLSEIYSLHLSNCSVSDFWKYLFGRAKSGALFVYVDNGSSLFNEYSRELFETAGLEEVTKQVDQQMTPRVTEQASELNEYRKKFVRNPKLKTRITYRVLRKP